MSDVIVKSYSQGAVSILTRAQDNVVIQTTAQATIVLSDAGVIYAPTFAGVAHMQVRFSDLVGTLAIGDPIGSVTPFGTLVASPLTASGTARPTLAQDGLGRVHAALDGVDDVLSVSGLSLSFSGGFSMFAVVDRDTTSPMFSGIFRADAGSVAAAGSIIEWYTTSTGTSINRALINRLGGVIGYFDRSGWPANTVTSEGAIFASAAGVRGAYVDGTLVASTLVGATAVPPGTVTRIRTTGYNDTKFKGKLYDLVVYQGVLTAPQIAEVTTYLRNQWNGGAAF